MIYVYVLSSLHKPELTYIGLTNDLRRRLREHNAGQSGYTKKFMPWRLETYIAFSNQKKAPEFERYLKKGGGWRFAKRRLI